jgi:hypothetical protein
MVLESAAAGGRGAPDGAPFCASCEVHRLPTAAGGGADAWLLACVFVPPALRGRGCGAALVRAVAAAAAAAGAPALWLFSDIGAPFYEALGFRAAEGGAFDVLLPPAPGEPSVAVVEDLFSHALPADAPVPSAPPAGGCSLQLERARVEWLLLQERLRVGAGALRAAAPCAGARCGGAEALWRVSRAPRGEEEELLLLSFSGAGEEAAAVLRRAQAVAAAAGLARVRMWDVQGVEVGMLVEGALRVQREGKLPMVLPLSGEPGAHTAAPAIQRGCWY